jgi:site-specific DNA-methyltransferase (adenine-specific)
MTMQPYYEHNGMTIYHGDAREILSSLAPVDTIITDPVWPNAPAGIYAGADRPAELFAEIAAHFPRLARRVVVQLGCNSDPRFLCGIPPALPFLRTCWLEYALPSHIGRVLYSGDVAYVYGSWPQWRKGAGVFPGRAPKAQPIKVAGHPTPRAIEHVTWLANWYARGPILDPCCGLGTTLEAARRCGYPAIGIEIEERYCEATVQRLELQAVMELT